MSCRLFGVAADNDDGLRRGLSAADLQFHHRIEHLADASDQVAQVVPGVGVQLGLARQYLLEPRFEGLQFRRATVWQSDGASASPMRDVGQPV